MNADDAASVVKVWTSAFPKDAKFEVDNSYDNAVVIRLK